MIDLLPQLTSMAGGINPFDWVNGPSLGPFESVLKKPIGIALGLAWALAFCWAGFHFLSGLSTMAAGRRNKRADAVEEGKETMLWSGGVTIALVALPTIYGVLTSI